MFNLLDVAVGPTLLVVGLIFFGIIILVSGLVFFSIKAICKIKADRDNYDR